ncbi:MAG: Septum formation initiator [Parcubacteria group bacterium GW2011_GWA2_36_10]|nr:MAG: Septum formation initiator [Parcubacteria group bacterium GW2011_GWA2_36_10]
MIQRSRQTFWGRFYNSNVFIILLSVFLVFSLFKVGKELIKRHAINQEIGDLNEQLVSVQQEKDKLKDLVSYLETDKYVEEQARLQLNLSKPGEKRIDLTTDQENQVVEFKNGEEDLSNWQKWFNYFFPSNL